LGARAMAVVSILTGKYRLSKRGAAEALEDLFGLRVCDGTICNTESRVAAVLETPVEEAKAYVALQPVVHIDETGWWLGKQRAWLWSAVTVGVTVFLLSLSRGAKVAKELLGEAFGGIAISDRYSAYHWIAAAHRQVCWSHLKRDFQKIAERGEQSAEIGNTLLYWRAEMFALWDRFQTHAISRLTLRRQMAPIRAMIADTLRYGTACSHPKTANTCRQIVAVERALWTFLRVEGVQPTNNSAERAIRPAVMWRKTSFGTDSDTGARFVERVLTVTATCRQQDRNPLTFIHEAILAAFSNRPAPSLLPAT
ncbi:MAG: IS66 family transposase, partial [Vicinamibacterales bacterium]